MNPKNDNNNCFQYALTVALNYQKIKKDPQRILSLLLISIIVKKYIFRQNEETGKSLNQIISQLLLTLCLCHTIRNKPN